MPLKPIGNGANQTLERALKAPYSRATAAVLILGACLFPVLFGQTRAGRAQPSQPAAPLPVTLTPEETAWLRAHPRIRVAQDPSWPPVEFDDEKGEPSGIAADYLALIEQRLGLKFERVRGLSWQESFTRLKRGDLDMTTCVAATVERETFWAFTKPYLTIPIVILTRHDVPYIENLRALAGRNVAVVEGYVSEEWIEQDFPDIRLVRVKNIQEGFDLVKKGDVEALVGNMLVIGYNLTKLKRVDLKIVGQTPYVNAQAMAVRKDWGILAGILQKGLDTISEEEAAEIYHKWVPIRYEHKFDFRFVLYLLGAFLLVLSGLSFWIWRMNREIRRRRAVEKALKTSEEIFKSFFEVANVGKSMTLPTGQINVNGAFCSMLGYSREELAGKTWQELTPPEDVPAIEERLAPLLQGQRDSTRFEKRYIHKNGSLICGDLSVVMLRDVQGRPSYFITTVIDITERKRAEETIRASLLEKEATLREIHHRVKNSLQIISSLFNLQAGYIKDEKFLRIFKEGQNRIRSMSLIHEKLHESGDLTKIDFAGYLRSLVSLLLQTNRIKGGRIRLEMDLNAICLDINSAVPCGLLANELISNVLKHAFPAGRSGLLRIGLRRETEGKIALTIADDGQGLPPGLDFRQTDSFGFQIIQSLVGQLDGTIALDPSAGTSFIIVFRELDYKKRI